MTETLTYHTAQDYLVFWKSFQSRVSDYLYVLLSTGIRVPDLLNNIKVFDYDDLILN